jgi:hypothetical protein
MLKLNDAKRNHDYLKLLTQTHHQLYILRHGNTGRLSSQSAFEVFVRTITYSY